MRYKYAILAPIEPGYEDLLLARKDQTLARRPHRGWVLGSRLTALATAQLALVLG
ncbi:MAG: hypothetical protein AB9897_03015 [Anaerolineaceae bacterium]